MNSDVKVLINKIWVTIIKISYPLYGTAEAIITQSHENIVYWLCYWACFCFFSFIETFASPILDFIPFSATIQIFFHLWLQIPFFHGSKIIISKLIAPFYSRNKNHFDLFIPCNLSQFRSSLNCASWNFQNTYYHYLDKLEHDL